MHIPRWLAAVACGLGLIAAGSRGGWAEEAKTNDTALAVNQKARWNAKLASALERGYRVVKRSVENYPKHRDCFSCHHQTLPLLALAMNQRNSPNIPPNSFWESPITQSIRDFTRASFESQRNQLNEGKEIGGRALTVGYGLWTFDLAGVERCELTDAMVEYLRRKQAADGAWDFHSFRPPASSSRAMTTALAIFGLRCYGHDYLSRKQLIDIHHKANEWSRTAEPGDNQEELNGLVWLDYLLNQQFSLLLPRDVSVSSEDSWGSTDQRRRELFQRLTRRIEEIKDRQNEDGGWGQTSEMESDAYATAQTLLIMNQADYNEKKRIVSESIYRKGIRYLLKTQKEDGSWHVITRAKPVQVFFDNGDPYGKDQFISMMATHWAVAAIANYQVSGDAPLESARLSLHPRRTEHPISLWSHLDDGALQSDLREMNAKWKGDGLERVLVVDVKPSKYAWVTLPAPTGGWDWGKREAIAVEITNRGRSAAEILWWAVGDRGWDAVVDIAELASGDTRTFRCRLRDTYPDGTPKIDPNHVKQLQLMVARQKEETTLEVSRITAAGNLDDWQRPADRLEVPASETAQPAPGKRVRYRLNDEQGEIYSILYLPEDWRAGQSYPLIVEYPGNLFFTSGCYSTGLPEQCVIGYGMTRGKGAIWISLPFVDYEQRKVVESGWGVPDDTADYALRMVSELIERFGADRQRIVLTGFSRGAIACGFIGLRNDRIASLWKGFHACQHYDGDGWNGATMEDAMIRAKRFRGSSVFQTDNSAEKFGQLMDAMKADATFVRSELGAHACAMFLDDRPSTRQLREWYEELIRK